MAKLGKINHNQKRAALVEHYQTKRSELRTRSVNAHLTQEEREEARQALALLPRNSCAIRLRHRCELTGRPRGYLRKFKLSRIKFRELASLGLLPGVTKSSW